MPVLTLQLRRLGKKTVRQAEYILPNWPTTVRELILTCVRAEVDRYNRQQRGEGVLPYLLPAQIDAQLATTGKVGFGQPAEQREVALQSSIDAALLAFQDGLFTVFVDDTECTELDQAIVLSPTTTLTFIRLTLLAGSTW